MIFLYGKYRLGKKRIAYRNDFCLACESEKVAEQFRTFDLGHLFFIPVLPLGHRKHWHCTACGNNPHERTQTSKNLIVVFAVVVGLFAAFTWVGPFIPTSDAATVWSMRLIFSLGFAGLVFWIKNKKPVAGLQERLSGVRPLTGDKCLYCGGGLDHEGYCSVWGIAAFAVYADWH